MVVPNLMSSYANEKRCGSSPMSQEYRYCIASWFALVVKLISKLTGCVFSWLFLIPIDYDSQEERANNYSKWLSAGFSSTFPLPPLHSTGTKNRNVFVNCLHDRYIVTSCRFNSLSDLIDLF
jgi:hypothetical protein